MRKSHGWPYRLPNLYTNDARIRACNLSNTSPSPFSFTGSYLPLCTLVAKITSNDVFLSESNRGSFRVRRKPDQTGYLELRVGTLELVYNRPRTKTFHRFRPRNGLSSTHYNNRSKLVTIARTLLTTILQVLVTSFAIFLLWTGIVGAVYCTQKQGPKKAPYTP